MTPHFFSSAASETIDLIHSDTNTQYTQTTQPIRMQASVSTQCDENQVSQNLIVEECPIFNVQDKSTQLPLINIQLANHNVLALLDTGSSISVIDQELFHNIKSFVTYKFISRKVVISTLNSKVDFSACVSISFKINSKHFKQHFFVTQLQDKPFKALLGFDFLQANHVILDTHQATAKFKQFGVPFVNPLTSCDNPNESSCNVLKSGYISSEVSLAQKVMLEPNEQKYVKVKINEKSTPKLFMFQPSFKNANIVSYASIHNFESSSDDSFDICNRNCTVTSSNSQNSVNFTSNINVNKQSEIDSCKSINVTCEADNVYITNVNNNVSNASDSNHFSHFQNIDCPMSDASQNVNKPANDVNNSKFSHFYIVVHNISDKIIHLNKNAIIGDVEAIDLNEIKANSVDLENISPHESQQFVNLIQPSSDVIQLRRSEFNISNFNLNHLNVNESQQLATILNDNFQAFSTTLKSLGHTDRVVPELKFNHNYPIKTLPFPLPQAVQADAKQQLDELQAADIIERGVSEWSSPMLLVKKKPDANGKTSYRLAVDLRLVNQVIQCSSYPLPKINDIISNIAKYQFFTTLDLKNAYHQIDLPEKYRDQLSTTTIFGLYKFKRLTFGLKTAASIFQALMDLIIEEANIDGVYAYQDDIVIGSNSFKETCTKLNTLLKVFIKHNLTIFPDKCSFHTDEINYLGFKISNNQVSPIQSNIQKIVAFQLPSTKKQLKRFIGLCGYYRHLIHRYAHVIHPLVHMTSPSVPLTWTEEAKQSFNSLQAIFFKAPFVRQPNWNSTFYLNTDASCVAISAVLAQKFNGQLHPISYFSKTLSKSEANYPALKLELMAIVKGVSAFRHYLFNRHFKVLSDSKPLEHFRRTTSPANIITRWLLELSEYSFTFKHIPGILNKLPDYISREAVIVQKDLSTDPNLLDTSEVLPTILNEDGVCNTQGHDDNSFNDVAFVNNVNDNNDDNVTNDDLSDNNLSQPVFVSNFLNVNSLGVIHSGEGARNHVLGGAPFAHISPPTSKLPHNSHNCSTLTHMVDACQNAEATLTHHPITSCVDVPVTTQSDTSSKGVPNLPSFYCNTVESQSCSPNNVKFRMILNELSTTKKDAEFEISAITILQNQLRCENTRRIYNKVLNNQHDPEKYSIDAVTHILYTTKKIQKQNLPFLNETNTRKIVLPSSLWNKAMHIAHMTHYGVAKTYENFSRRFFVKGAFDLVSNYVASCKVCNVNKIRNIPRAPLQDSITPSRPSQVVTSDIVGPICDGVLLITFVDHFSRHLQVYHAKSIDGNVLSEFLFDYISRFGRPEIILSDNGPQYRSATFVTFTEKLGIRLSKTSIGNPQANGIAERLNKELKNSILTLVTQGVSLDQAVKLHTATYNASIHSAIKTSPNLVHFGRALPAITDTFTIDEQSPILDNASRMNQILKDIESFYNYIHNNSKNARMRSFVNANKNRHLKKFQVGDTVYLKHINKFKKQFQGPFTVIKVKSPVIVVIQELFNPHARTMSVHINRLRISPPRQQFNESTTRPTNIQHNLPAILQPRTISSNPVPLPVTPPTLQPASPTSSPVPLPVTPTLQPVLPTSSPVLLPVPQTLQPSPVNPVQPHSYNLRPRR